MTPQFKILGGKVAWFRGSVQGFGRNFLWLCALTFLCAGWHWKVLAQHAFVGLERLSLHTSSPAGGEGGVFVTDNRVFWATGSKGLEILDVSDPAQPVVLGTFDAEGREEGVWVAGNYAFLASGTSGFSILDVSDPNRLREVASYRFGSSSYGYAERVFVSGNLAFVTGDSIGLQIFDVSTPGNIVPAGRLALTDTSRTVQVKGNWAYVASGSRILAIDVTDPYQPALKGAYAAGSPVYGLQIVGDLAYVAAGDSGLAIVDLSNPTLPVRVGFCPTVRHALDIHVSGDHAYVAGGDGMEVINIADPSNPVLVGNAAGPMIERFWVRGNTAYAAGYGQLQVFAITQKLLGIMSEPKSQSCRVAAAAAFNVSAIGVAPLGYRWHKDGRELADNERIQGAATAALTINNLCLEDQGQYMVVLSNADGTLSSSNALLTVIPGDMTLADSLDSTSLLWLTGGSVPWRSQSEINLDGEDAAQGGPIRPGIISQWTWLETTVAGPGSLSFWWRVAETSSIYSAYGDLSSGFVLKFSIGGQDQAIISTIGFGVSSDEWECWVGNIPSGPQKLRWEFSSLGGCVNPKTGRAWLDQVLFDPAAAPVLCAQPQSLQVRKRQTVTLSVVAAGTEPLSCQWYLGRSGDTSTPIPGAVTTSYTAVDLAASSRYWVRVTNAFGAADSQTASVEVVPSLTVLTTRSETLTMEVQGLAGKRVQFQYSTNLVNWVPLDSPLPGVLGDTPQRIDLPCGPGNQRFYRAVECP